MPKERIALQLFTVRNLMKTAADATATLKKVKQIGYEGVELAGLGPLSAKEFAAVLKGEGLAAPGCHTDLNRLQKDLPGLIDELKVLECSSATIAVMPDEFRTAEGFCEFGRVMTKIAPDLLKAGITLGYHNHSFEFERFGNKPGLQLFYENSDPALVKAEIDTYWVQHGGADPADWITRMKGRLPLLHAKDMSIRNSPNMMTQVFVEVGEGNLNWKRIIPACREAGVVWFTVEQDTCERDPLESAAISLRNLRAMLA